MKSDFSHLHNRRWYDHIGELTMAIHVSRQLPPDIQLVIARHLNEAIDGYRKLRRNDRHAVSLGPQRTLGLYKAGNRKRWYDPRPELHRAYTLMSTVPDHYLSRFAARILQAGRYLDNQPEVPPGSDRFLLTSAVEHLLKADKIGIQENREGIRLVTANQPLPPAGQSGSAAFIRNRRPGPPPR